MYYFVIDFDAELTGQIFAPELMERLSLFSYSFTSKFYDDQEELVNACNENAISIVTALRDAYPDIQVKKFQNDGHEEFEDNEICKMIFVSEEDVVSDTNKTPDLSYILDQSPVTISIFNGE